MPANRIGYTTLTLPQLKIVQEIVTLAVFVPFAIFYMRTPSSWTTCGQGCAWWRRVVHVPGRTGMKTVCKSLHPYRGGLHWLIAGLVLAALFMGWTMTDMEISPGKLKLYNYHKWVGVTVLALALLRLGWRFTHRPPPLEPMPRWQQIAANCRPRAVVSADAGGAADRLGLQQCIRLSRSCTLAGFPCRICVDRDKLLAAQLVQVHGTAGRMCWRLPWQLHVLAALQHHFIRKDRTLRRMLSWHGPGA